MGSRLAGLLEKPTQPEQVEETELATDHAEADVEPMKGRGPAPKKPRSVEARTAKKIRGRTVYIPDDLFERIIVQAHRRDRTISEYVVGILERQVPDHRVIRADPGENGAA